MDFCATIESHEVFRRFVKCLQSLARLGQDDIGFLVTKRALYLVTENSSATCKALCTFPATVFHTFEYTVNTHSAIVNSTQGCTVQNLDSSECVTLESAFRIKSKALTSIRWSETKDHFCRITVRGIEANEQGVERRGYYGRAQPTQEGFTDEARHQVRERHCQVIPTAVFITRWAPPG